MLQFGASLTNNTRSINYNRNMFIIQATEVITAVKRFMTLFVSMMNLVEGCVTQQGIFPDSINIKSSSEAISFTQSELRDGETEKDISTFAGTERDRQKIEKETERKTDR
jgi:hypothetical protein